MWVRAQIDYLQRLPTDKEKRKALKDLPPDLPQTYVRILETIDCTYPIQTKKFIQRLLKWLMLHKLESESHDADSGYFLTSRVLRQAICIENNRERLSDSEMPSEEQILGWLGCLVRKSKSADTIELSHFTIEEFLRMDPENVSSAVARKYLVQHNDHNYLLQVCLTHLMNEDFRSMKCSMLSGLRSFRRDDPLYAYAAMHLIEYVCELTGRSTGMNEEVTCIMQMFLSTPVHEAFLLWHRFYSELSVLNLSEKNPSQEAEIKNYFSPLHFAALTGLADEVQRLCNEGLDPNCASFPVTKRQFTYTPLHLALIHDGSGPLWLSGRVMDGLKISILLGQDDTKSEQTSRIIGTLVEAGANVNQQLCMDDGPANPLIVTPLVLALMSGQWRVACVLLDEGADCDAIAHENESGLGDLCSVGKLLDYDSNIETEVQRAVNFGGHQGLNRALERWRDRRVQLDEENDGHSQEESDEDSDGHSQEDIDPQARFVDACRSGKWSVARELLQAESGIEINRNDEDGMSPLWYCVSSGNSEDVRHLLERGADPNLLHARGLSVLTETVLIGRPEIMSLLLEFGANTEHQGPYGYTALIEAIELGRHEMVKQLLTKKANPDAVINDGEGGLHLAIKNKDTAMVSLLLKCGLNPALVDNYGSTPLHFACKFGLQFEVQKLIVEKLIKAAPDRINDDCLINGTPLYLAAREGFVSIVQTLLDAGAAIDKTGPGNLLGSALMVACAEGENAIVRLLLSRGASCEVEGSRFLSAAGTARAFRHEEILEILEEYPHPTSPTKSI